MGAIINPMIIFLITTAVSIALIHNFIMRSVDNYTGYDNGRKEWEQFQSSRFDSNTYRSKAR
jgi:hypothetical protein